MRLKTKIHLLTTLLMLVIVVATNSGIYLLYEKFAYDTEYNQLQSRANELSSTLSQLNAQTNLQQVLRAYMPTDGAVYIYDGELLKTKVQATLEMQEVPSITYTMPAIWIDGTVVDITLQQSMEEVERTLDLLKVILVVVSVVASIPIFLASLVLGRLILLPLERLNETMRKSASTGKYEKIDTTEKGGDELTNINRTFNMMMEKLEQHYQKQQEFVSNASHELKTPITVIESYAKLLLRRGFDNREVAQESLQAIANESSRMHEMVLQLLELAKNKEQLDVHFEQLELAPFLNKVALQMEQAYHRTFRIDEQIPKFIYSDEKILKQLLFILLDNARKYSEDEVRIQATETTNHVRITIQDFGIGIPIEHIPHLFERFYRVTEDRNRKTGGSGLGLAIAHELAQQLGITIDVKSKLGEGSSFTLCIPKEGQQ
ncbi:MULTISPECIES: HAMP domain-containing sensor histidine kinase [Lysinibacillus]|uniref:HAMP domain-containing sensor histidine kinase n=1 Tax=Lysinibacillus TaxID=400634 RepID=UPI001C8C8F10|nr:MULTISPECIES: HAMP domain-containing sensor histidine kinase [Lysinibacillus]WHP40279.1 HAMP domain-containing sensor histidine kinase [Lysinibacillus boronitolerans]MBX8946920.1 HAMP domain-containing histidine kinase [Lysinibacillus sp. K60]UUV24768.1 HAMP domain-containing histidine kinase [Lysinibacillus sp. FN11]UYB47639.1 HAMP domain-containing histidine kinase [Lysinibacillus capsici]WDU79809.1 HAMP domain-containing sensor histidine kinase [Lysinibacillus sp. G01H]